MGTMGNVNGMRRTILAATLGASLLTGCTSAGNLEQGEIRDPLEPLNRLVFSVNDALDTIVLRPIAYAYKEVAPEFVRDAVRGFLRWLRSPVILVNDLLQGDFMAARDTAVRFFVNAPVLGLYDIGNEIGFDYRDEDFGQTLGTYGFEDGYYIVLPLLGPSNVRDVVGRIVDYFLDPLNFIEGSGADVGRVAVGAATAIDFRARNFDLIDDTKASSVDYYARVRTVYKQFRDAAIRNGAPPPLVDMEIDNSSQFDNFVPGSDLTDQSGAKKTE